MDDGIWAIWYDLPDDRREKHLGWLHGTHLPELAALPGIAWAAHYEIQREIYKGPRDRLPHTDETIGEGNDYLLLVGATSPHVFFKVGSPIFEKNQSEETRRRIAERVGARALFTAEEARITGPEYGTAIPCGTPAPAIQMGSYRMTSPETEIGIAEWYAQSRMPQLSRMPGCVQMRKLVGIAGWAKHAVLYEFTSLDARQKNIEKPYDEWTARAVAHTLHAPGSPCVGERIWPQA
jgi:hypothetical protein